MNPAVYKAVASGDAGFLKKIRDGDVSINNYLLHQTTPKGNNVLHIAAEFKKIDVFETLGPDPLFSELFWATNKKGETPLHIASRVGCGKAVEFLIEHAKTVQSVEEVDVESGIPDGEAHKQLLRMANSQMDTAMHAAVRGAHPRVVTLLMEADPQLCCLTNRADESPLFLATRHRFSDSWPSLQSILSGGRLFRIARSILNECPISPSFEGTNGVTALHAAVTSKSNKGLVKLMVSKHPVMVKKVDVLGWTPLHYAALTGFDAATHILLEADSSASYIYDNAGMSALHVAAFAGHISIMKKIICCRPDTCDVVNDKGQTVLHAAVLGGQTGAVMFILKAREFSGIINEADTDGNTPLHLAVIYKCYNVIQVLTNTAKVNKIALNTNFSQAGDTFLRSDDKFQQDANTTLAFLLGLKKTIGVSYFQEQILQDLIESQPPKNETSSTPESISADKREKPQSNISEAYYKRFDTKLLVVVLIATVTFAAAFTVPGGFKSDGTPVLIGKPSFKVFLLLDAISFFLSIFMVYFHFYEANIYKILGGAGTCWILCSIVGMAVAFASGIYAELPNGGRWLGVLVLVICGFLSLWATIVNLYVPNKRQRKKNWLRRCRI